ncbi:hypothetical protein Scep_021179 [Stephania cephalantha]|uniref:tRNA pseudouridine(55) synthase n=1 Tax=Stephania cephalantha TaxID=152367 RepID=A0AAP0F2Y6_9MAGN
MANSHALARLSLLFSLSTQTRPLSLLTNSLRLSTTATPYPLQYDLIIPRPASPPPPRRLRRRTPSAAPPSSPTPSDSPEPGSVENWVERKLDSVDKSKRKYYRKRRKRMYGSDSDEGGRDESDGFVELKQEIVDFPTLHKREEELYFYDAFAYPWEKEKHYKMVYQLEKKYFPDQCLDKAFLDPGGGGGGGAKKEKGKEIEEKRDEGMVFFEGGEERRERKVERVEEFFKCLKKLPNEKGNGEGEGEAYMLSRKTELPPRWDGPHGTVVLVNKPKGRMDFIYCLWKATAPGQGAEEELIQVGHAGTLDPMATGLLIVCVGKATKIVDSFQGMIKGYSGVFRLGEATSTWDADSPVIQREPWEHIKDEDIRKAAASFCGEIWQVPPMFSAIKVGGEKMYDKARRGETVELSPRRISIYQFEIERSLNDRQNLIFRVTCSKGTYIRSLCADLGKALGSCAHLTALRRDSIGPYLADDAWDFPELEEAITKAYF